MLYCSLGGMALKKDILGVRFDDVSRQEAAQLGRFRTVLPVAVPHCAGVEFGMSFTCGGAFVELVPAIIRFIRKKTPTSAKCSTVPTWSSQTALVWSIRPRYWAHP